MSATEFCDSSGIGRLILANKQAARTGVELRVVVSSPAVLRALHVLEADRLLHLYPDMAAALAGAASGVADTG
jgi:anti-anti-sigma factor